jgi:histidinol dehydrogenase
VPAEVSAWLRSLVPGGASVRRDVEEIVAGVRERGDKALSEYAERFDGVAAGSPLRVDAAEIASAMAALDDDVRAGLELAIENVGAVAGLSLGSDGEIELPQGQVVRVRELPVRRAAIYVPGGRAPYPSTVVMGVVTARVAGVEQIVVCAPGADPVILAACGLCGVEEVYRVGGSHAVAAMAYGTETIERVDVVAGPGNLYVQEAKRQVSGDVGIDGFLGPSDLLVLAGAEADLELIALDLEAQAEHGEGTIVVAVSDSSELCDRLAQRLAELAPAVIDARDDDSQAVGTVDGSRATAMIVKVRDLEQGLALAEGFAPEHLELVGAAEALAPRVRSAGCVFIGAPSATAFGDYVSGSNHSLPTGGAARFGSALSPRAFRRRMAEVRIGPAAAALAPAGAAIARAEGFDVHAASMEARVWKDARQ